MPTVTFLVNIFRTFSHFIDAGLHRAILINVGFNPEYVSKYGGIVVGPLMSKLEVYGKKGEWEPVLKKLIPQKTLPAWYGGSEDFKPVQVYG
ncbi:unnamed protein product [Allacma fusca]|uniref:Uncharacterized protein n=1 Tax=Allacma fusca TaxID=39272 RepID=A0A8J2KWT8_9HEXA|nr:unnamed protein product [Allacma fusca]